jgi:hypothetical protein
MFSQQPAVLQLLYGYDELVSRNREQLPMTDNLEVIQK